MKNQSEKQITKRKENNYYAKPCVVYWHYTNVKRLKGTI